MGRTMLTSLRHLPLLVAGCALPTIAAAQTEPRPMPVLPTATSQANDPAKISNNDASSDAAAATAAGSTAPAEGPTQEASESLLGDIVVTAQRREERLQDVPAAISAIGTKQLSAAGIINTRDLQLVTPSISFTQASYAPQPAIRGIGTRGVNPGDEQVVPVYLDGVYQPFIVGGLFELANVERIEVLRGPQGTLLGRNATGGAINIITETPQSGFSGRVTLGYGRFNERLADGYITGGDDRVAASLNVQYLEDDGYVRDIANNNRRLASIDSIYVRAKVRIAPTDTTTLTAAISHANRYDDTSLANFALNGNTIARQGRPTLTFATGNRKTSQDIGFAPSLRTRQDAISLTVVQNLPGLDITSISGYSESELDYAADADMTPAQVIRLSVLQYDRSFTQELFAATTGSGPFQLVAGLFYFNNKAGQDPRNLNGGLIFTDTRADAYAAYAQGTYAVTDRLNLTVGGRYSYDKKSATARSNGANFLPFVERSWDSFNPSASVDFALTPATKVYARYATAFKSGVFNATGFARNPVNPEQVETFEVGLKSDPLPWLRLNLAAFYTNYDNIQIFARSADPNNASVVLENAATAKIKGVEGDITARLFDGFTARISASYLDAKYDQFPNASSLVRRADGAGNTAVIIDASGNDLARAPEFTGNIGGEYRFDALGGTITIGANAYYNSGFAWSVDDRLRQGAYGLVNGQVMWSSPDDRLTLTAWGRNLTNSEPLLTLSSSVLGDQAAYTRPITYGLRAGVRF